ncbi:sensor histidine kinase [Nonomuraea sp. NPDC050663]|uniref:sensor histidine kinase n=1 Tax=Nonomuraea sp. NPDC050663 TaxID=3364370 RepID=UPI0037B105A5
MSGNIVMRRVGGVVSGLLLGLVELAFVCVAWPVTLLTSRLPGGGGAVERLAGRGLARLLAAERRRLRRWFDHEAGQGRAGYGYLAVRGLLGVVAGYGFAAAVFLTGLLLAGGVWDLVRGTSEPVRVMLPGVRVVTSGAAVGFTTAGLLIALVVLGATVVGAAERWLAGRFLGPGEVELMRLRIAELTSTRAGIVRAVDDERRRIERDLHDGVQQRGVALAMLLGRARHELGAENALDGDRTLRRTAELVEEAYGESRRLLDELRSVAWRIYPTALDELGLEAALAGAAERSQVPVTIHHGLTGRLPSEAETAIYFVVREAITNAVKHSGADDILVVLEQEGRTVSVSVSDNGRGGADPAGGGLAGLARRVLALDGTFAVRSPDGGPTEITARLPCA